MRGGSLSTTSGAVCLGLGVVLLLVEAFRALTGTGLGSVEQAVLWAGLGLLVVGVVLLLLGSVRGAASDGQTTDSPVDDSDLA